MIFTDENPTASIGFHLSEVDGQHIGHPKSAPADRYPKEGPRCFFPRDMELTMGKSWENMGKSREIIGKYMVNMGKYRTV